MTAAVIERSAVQISCYSQHSDQITAAVTASRDMFKVAQKLKLIDRLRATR